MLKKKKDTLENIQYWDELEKTAREVAMNQTQKEKLTYRGYPAIGSGASMLHDNLFLQEIYQTLICNWEGAVVALKGHPDSLDLHMFAAGDKGAPCVYGIDKNGLVVASITFFKGDKRAEIEEERSEHFYISKTFSTSTLD